MVENETDIQSIKGELDVYCELLDREASRVTGGSGLRNQSYIEELDLLLATATMLQESASGLADAGTKPSRTEMKTFLLLYDEMKGMFKLIVGGVR